MAAVQHDQGSAEQISGERTGRAYGSPTRGRRNLFVVSSKNSHENVTRITSDRGLSADSMVSMRVLFGNDIASFWRRVIWMNPSLANRLGKLSLLCRPDLRSEKIETRVRISETRIRQMLIKKPDAQLPMLVDLIAEARRS